jgi:hypothetical protein
MTNKIKIELPSSRLHLLIITSGVIFAVSVIFFLPPYLNWVTELGHRISFYNVKHDYTVANDYATALVFAAALGASIIVWPIKSKDKYHLFWAWILKCSITLFILLFLEDHYPEDSFGYWSGPLFPEFKDLYSYRGLIANVDFSQRGTGNVLMFLFNYNKLVPEFMAISFHSAKLLFSMIALIAIYIFYRASVIFTRRENIFFFWLLVLFPSILIWASRIGKESMILFTISLYIFGIVSWNHKKRARHLILIVIGFILTTHLRAWMGIVLAGPMIFYFLFSQKGVARIFSLLLAVVVAGLALNFAAEGFKIQNVDDVVERMATNTSNKAKGGSKLNSVTEFRGVKDVVVFAPLGMFTALFRPLPGDMSSPTGLLASLEGLLLLFLFIKAFVRTKIVEFKDPLIIMVALMVASWAFLYGFASQNFGTIVRWKTQILPLYLGLVLYLGRPRSRASLDIPPSNSVTFGN